MTLPSRKSGRTALVAYLKSDATVDGNLVLSDDADGFEHVKPNFPKDFQGRSPIAGVEGSSVKYDIKGDDTKETPFYYIVGFWARSMENREDAEDMLDALALQLATILRKYFNSEIDQRSVTDYEIIDGIEYKFELHYIEIDW